MNIPERLKSRKFWVAITSAVVLFLNSYFEFGLDTNEAITIVLVIVSYLLGQSYVDGNQKDINNE